MSLRLTESPLDCGCSSAPMADWHGEHRSVVTTILLTVLILSTAQLPALSSGKSFADQSSLPKNAVPEVLVWIDARNAEADSVSITYSKLVPRAEVEDDIARLVQGEGWTIYSAEISEDEWSEAEQPPMTSAMLALGRPAGSTQIGIPVASVVTAFKRFQFMKVVYAAPAGFHFRGPSDFENKHVNIKVNRGINTYEYTVTVKDANFESLNLPLEESGAGERQRQTDGRKLLAIVFLIAAGVLAAALTYLLAARVAGRGRNDSLRRS